MAVIRLFKSLFGLMQKTSTPRIISILCYATTAFRNIFHTGDPVMRKVYSWPDALVGPHPRIAVIAFQAPSKITCFFNSD